jgi:hypothetical protein
MITPDRLRRSDIAYQPVKTWHQDLMVHVGFVLALDGRRDGATMVITGKDYPNPGVTRMHRLNRTRRSRFGSKIFAWFRE